MIGEDHVTRNRSTMSPAGLFGRRGPFLFGLLVSLAAFSGQSVNGQQSITAIVPEVVWNLGADTLYQVRLDQLFANSGYATVTLDPPETSWYRSEVVEKREVRFLKVSKKFVPYSRSRLMLSSRIVALGQDGMLEASIALQAILPPHEILYRYPQSSSMASGLHLWYPDDAMGPPATFEHAGSYANRYDTLRVADAPPESQSGDAPWRGRSYILDSPVSTDSGIVVTASLYVPSAWVSPAAVTPMATEVVVDFAFGGLSGGNETLFRLHMGFDNADEAWREYGPFAYLYLDGPLTKLYGTPGVWPFSALGSLLAFAFPGPNPRKSDNWRGVVRPDAWNDFSFSVTRKTGDTGIYRGVPRDCQETARIEFWLNGHRWSYMDDPLGIVTMPCLRDRDGSTVASTFDTVRSVGVRVRGNSPGGNTAAYWSDINLFRGDADFDAIVPLSPPPMQPPCTAARTGILHTSNAENVSCSFFTWL